MRRYLVSSSIFLVKFSTSISLVRAYAVILVGKGSGGLNPSRRFCPELARNGEAKVLDEEVLLAENSILRTYLA